MAAADFDVKTMPREELERELEARRDEYAAASKALEDSGVPEVVEEGEDSVWRALALRVRLLGTKNKEATKALLSIEWQQNGGGTFTCRGCGSWTFSPTSHADHCLVDKALRELGLNTARERVDEKRRLNLHAPEWLAVHKKENP